MEPYVRRKDIGKGISEIEFFHPKHNSMPGELLSRLAQKITETGEDETVGVIILKSGGDRTFCAGASFDELINIDDFNSGKEFFMGFANVINACRKCTKLIIGRVQGKAVGGGVGLAAVSDYCLATKYASIKLSELNVGIGPFVVGPAIERKIGVSAFSQLAINANEFRSAEWAKSKGLYADVYDTVEELDAEVIKLAEYLITTNPVARALLIGVFWDGTDEWEHILESRAELSGRLVLSDFTKKALSKYKT